MLQVEAPDDTAGGRPLRRQQQLPNERSPAYYEHLTDGRDDDAVVLQTSRF